MSTVRAYVDFARPFTLLPPALGVVSGAVTAWGAGHSKSPVTVDLILPILYGALNKVAEKTQDDPMKAFKKAIENVKPALEVKSRRVGGSTYQVPVEVHPTRKLALSIRWLIASAQSRGEKTMRLKLAGEFMDAAESRGGAIKKKEDTHRMAEANKAFAHYRW